MQKSFLLVTGTLRVRCVAFCRSSFQCKSPTVRLYTLLSSNVLLTCAEGLFKTLGGLRWQTLTLTVSMSVHFSRDELKSKDFVFKFITFQNINGQIK